MTNEVKITVQFEEFVISDTVIMMPCVPAVGSWITFPKSWCTEFEQSVGCNEFRVTSVNYNIDIKGNVCDIYVSVCVNTMFKSE